MKVKIGPYIHWYSSSIFSRYMDKKYSFDWPEEEKYDRKDKVMLALDNIVELGCSVMNKLFYDNAKRKISVTIDNYDVWSMDHTLAHIIVPMLEKLYESKHGAPFVPNEDVPAHLHIEDDRKYWENGETDDKFFERWDWVMDEMIFAFRTKLEYDHEINAEEQKRMTNGFRLFGKYYEALWD